MASDTLLELQTQREALKENLQDVNENIKKLTGRDPTENRRLSTNQRRFQLKRTSLGNSSNNQPPEKRPTTERRRWGSTVANKKKPDSGGEEEYEEKKPAVHSSVVATGKPIEVPKRPKLEKDNASVNRNRRMLGVLMGTLRQFKKESQFKSEQETKREEKLTKVEEQVEKERVTAQTEAKELFQTRRTKQNELRKLEFKISMTELGVELKQHYENLKDFIQLKSTPRVFYKPAKHNTKTLKLLEESQEQIKESLDQRLKEIEMCTEEDVIAARTQSIQNTRRESRISKDVTVIEPKQSKRDLFAEDEDDDKRQREADDASTTTKTDGKVDDRGKTSDDDDVVVVEKDTSSNKVGKVLNGSLHKVEHEPATEEEKVTIMDVDEKDEETAVESVDIHDSRRVVSKSEVVSDERVVQLSVKARLGGEAEDEEEVGGDEAEMKDDDINIYEDMQQNIELFQSEEM